MREVRREVCRNVWEQDLSLLMVVNVTILPYYQKGKVLSSHFLIL